MKVICTTISILMCVSFLAACDDNSQAQSKESRASYSSSIASEEILSDLSLNSGEKWRMDSHTRSSFVKMKTFSLSVDYTDEEELKRAGSKLQTQVDTLIRGCTMDGEAHNQLHMYLVPYIAAVESLSRSGEEKDAEKVKLYLEKYTDYFE